MNLGFWIDPFLFDDGNPKNRSIWLKNKLPLNKKGPELPREEARKGSVSDPDSVPGSLIT
jgi:hypothetical protein